MSITPCEWACFRGKEKVSWGHGIYIKLDLIVGRVVR